jgi:aryl-alcohol dehydrogenase-like predicted oxidoreductase
MPEPRRRRVDERRAVLDQMRQNQLGRSGLTVSVVGLGCNKFGRRLDRAGAKDVIDAALDVGITLFDTADIYGGRGESERLIGELLGDRRDRVVLATKFGMDMGDGAEARGAPEYVRRAIDASLRRLRTDHVDLYYYHEPDGTTPLEETLGALGELADAGKVRAYGVSNVDADQLRQAADLGDPRLAAVQNEYSLLERSAEHDVLPLAAELGIGFIPYFPLASGLLSGKFHRDQPPPAGTRMADRWHDVDPSVFDRIEALESFAAERMHSLLELAFAGLLAQPGVASVIAGAMSREQVEANAMAGGWQLADEDAAELAHV